MVKLDYRKRASRQFAVKTNFGTYLRLGKKGTSWVNDINEATFFTNKNTALNVGKHKMRMKGLKASVEVITVVAKIVAVDATRF